MATTDLDIVNMALCVLEEATINSLDDDDMAARLCSLHYDATREEELEKHDWVFAISRAELVGTDLGSGRMNWEYELPEDALRLVVPVTYDGDPDGIKISYRQDGNLLYTDQSSPRTIRYIANLIDPNDWDPLFRQVLVNALAVKLAVPITHQQAMLQKAANAYQQTIKDALRVNVIQRMGSLYTASWSMLRGDTRWDRP